MSKTVTFKFDMGEEVKDLLTGLTGNIVARIEHITGCNTYWVQRKHKAGEELKSAESFDEVRLKATGKKSPINFVQVEPKPGAMPTPKAARVK